MNHIQKEPPKPPTCEQCGEPLIRTSEAYLCCPNAHGKLVCIGSWATRMFAFKPHIARREATQAAKLFERFARRYDRAARKLANWTPTQENES